MALIPFYLDEDLSQDIAVAARSLGADVASAQKDNRRAVDDETMLLYAAQAGRCLVSRNTRDFPRLTISFRERGLPHAGVLLVPSSLRGNDYMVIASALAQYSRQHPEGIVPYLVDYLRPIRR